MARARTEAPAELDRRAASARKKENLVRVRVRVRVRIGVRVGVMWPGSGLMSGWAMRGEAPAAAYTNSQSSQH